MERHNLEVAIQSLRKLLSDDTHNEDAFQDWFEYHQIIFKLRLFKTVLLKPELTDKEGKTLVPDFMVQSMDDCWFIWELKVPQTPIEMGKQSRNKFYAEFDSYISQCTDYCDYFLDSQNREHFSNKYQTSIQQDVGAFIIAGRTNNINRFEIHKLTSKRKNSINHLTYDDIVTTIETFRANLFGSYENSLGYSFHLIFVPYEYIGKSNYIIDLGIHPAQDRISIFIAENSLIFRVIDSYGMPHENKLPLIDKVFYNNLTYFCFDLVLGDDYAALNIEFNNIFYDTRINALSISLPKSAQQLHFVLGSDVLGNEYSYHRICQYLLYDRTLFFEEKLKIRESLLDKYKENFEDYSKPCPGVHFEGHKFLHSEGHPNFTKSS